MISSPYSIPSSKKALEVTGEPYYVPTASPSNAKTSRADAKASAAKQDDKVRSNRVIGIMRRESSEASSSSTSAVSSTSSSSELNLESNASVIYVPTVVPTTSTATPAQPFGVQTETVKPVTPTFSVKMR